MFYILRGILVTTGMCGQPWHARDPVALPAWTSGRSSRLSGSWAGGSTVAGNRRAPSQWWPTGHAALCLPPPGISLFCEKETSLPSTYFFLIIFRFIYSCSESCVAFLFRSRLLGPKDLAVSLTPEFLYNQCDKELIATFVARSL